MERQGKKLLTRDDWVRAAYDTLQADGLAAVSVDRLAKRLGVSRGSFYWHFTGRSELLGAAIARWEQAATARAADLPDAAPAAQLRAIMRRVRKSPVDEVEIALAAAGDHPLAAAAYTRVTAARTRILRDLFARMGLPAAEIESRVWLLYAFHVGHHVIGRNSPVVRQSAADLDRIAALLSSPVPAGDRPARRSRRGGPGSVADRA